jgi:hypothetical protein
MKNIIIEQRNQRPNGSWYAASNRNHYLAKLALADMHADVYLPGHDADKPPRFMRSIRRTIDSVFPPPKRDPKARYHGRSGLGMLFKALFFCFN